jgi:hypothetical protein
MLHRGPHTDMKWLSSSCTLQQEGKRDCKETERTRNTNVIGLGGSHLSVILATQEAEIRRMKVWGQPQQKGKQLHLYQ